MTGFVLFHNVHGAVMMGMAMDLFEEETTRCSVPYEGIITEGPSSRVAC